MSLVGRTVRRPLFRLGLLFFVVGTGPLLLNIAASRIGWTDDPNPNPVGLGILAMFTFWPSLVMMAVATWLAWRAGEPAPTPGE